MTKVASLTADLSVKTSNFEAGLTRANSKLGAFNRSTNTFFASNKKGFTSVGSGVDTLVGKFNVLKGSIVAVVGAAGLTALIKQQLSAASAIKDTADRLELGTTALQKYQYAAKQVGIDNETLEQGIGKLNAKIADGSLKYKSAGDGLNAIADAVKNARTSQERLAIVNDQFGDKLGKKMLPMLKNGAAGLRALGDEALRTGNVIQDSTIQAADDLGDNLDALISTIEKNFSQGFLDQLVGQSGKLRDVYTDPKFAEGIKNLGSVFGDLAAEIIKAAGALGNFIGWYQKLSDEVHKWDKDAWNSLMESGSKAFDTPENRMKKMKRDAAEQNAAIAKARGGGIVVNASGSSTPDIPTGKHSPFKKTGKTTKELTDATKAIFDGLKQETSELKVQTDMYGQKASAIDRAKKAMEIQNKLTADGITLTQGQQAQLNKYLDTLEQQKQLQADQQKYNDEMKDFTDAVRGSFEDAILNGGKLSNVFNSLAMQIEKMALKKALLDPLFGDGSAGSTGLFTSILGGIGKAIFGPVPTASHATGQANVPYDMNVRVHKGERISTASETRRADNGGGQLTVKVIDRNNSKVTAGDAKQTAGGVELEVMVDRATAKHIGQRGSQTNQALGAYKNRTTVRR